MPSFGTPLWVVLNAPGCPDKKQLIEVQDFFKYTEKAGDVLPNLLLRSSECHFARPC